ncbi:hypothetical protein GCWU000182_00113 [Abiotrophia defectiva ATCC 49176]|uniref:Uncharacterized protein n=1 Tax=Abiotrophia defectiva ATCC 49176 TaxID=592010 RepID=W1Q5F8_ABIDE|nr:hypothetical protein GCWU000182_00113 [Abiotrophia defectiva ATCC 49176]
MLDCALIKIKTIPNWGTVFYTCLDRGGLTQKKAPIQGTGIIAIKRVLLYLILKHEQKPKLS